MSKFIKLVVAAALLSGFAFAAEDETTERPQRLRLTEEQKAEMEVDREALRAEMEAKKAEWLESLTDEERIALEEHKAEMEEMRKDGQKKRDGEGAGERIRRALKDRKELTEEQKEKIAALHEKMKERRAKRVERMKEFKEKRAEKIAELKEKIEEMKERIEAEEE